MFHSIDNNIFDGKNVTIKEYNLGRVNNDPWSCSGQIDRKKVEGVAVAAVYPSFKYTGKTGSGAWYGKINAYFRATNYYKGTFGWSKKRSVSTAIWGYDVAFYVSVGNGHSSSVPYFWHDEGDAQEITFWVYRTDYILWPTYPSGIISLSYDEVTFRGGGNVTCKIMNP